MSNALPHPAFGGVVGAVAYESLVMPGKSMILAELLIEAGQVLAKGSVLGAKTADGKLKLSASAAGDGSQVPTAVLLEDLDTTGADKVFSVLVEGFLNENALVFGAGHDANSVRMALRNVGIYLSVPRHSYM